MLQQKHDIQFEELTHTYRVNGQVKLHLTGILSPLNNFDEVPADVLAKAAKRGSDLHLAIHYDIKGTLDWNSLTLEQAETVEHWRYWVEQNIGLRKIHSEIRCYHDKLDLCCTVDLIIEDSVYELKFGAIRDVYVGAQTAGQADIVYNNFGLKINHRFALFPDDKGRFKTKPYKSKDDYRIFRKLLEYDKNIAKAYMEMVRHQADREEFAIRLMEAR